MVLNLQFPKDKPVVSVTEHDNYYLLQLNNPPDNRLTSHVIFSIMEALDTINPDNHFVKSPSDLAPKPLVIGSAIEKFFSNGLQLDVAVKTPNFFPDQYFRLLKEVTLFPWPTIALINGHAFAGGLMLVTCCDYRVMNPEKGWVCMNEVAFGADLFPPFVAMFRDKYGGIISRSIVQEGHRFTGPECFKLGMVDRLGGIDQVEEIIQERKLLQLSTSPSYATIRAELNRNILTYLDSFDFEANLREQNDKLTHDQREKRVKNVYNSKL